MAALRGTLPFTIETGWTLETAQGQEPGPLVVLLHGMGMRGTDLLRRVALPSPARHRLAPDGPYPTERRSAAGIELGHAWYVYDGDQAAFRAALERAESHLLRLLDLACRSQPVDPGRVSLLGYSQGGYLAGFVALRRRDRFRGLAIVSARLKHEFLEEELRAPDLPAVLFVHSPADPAVSWASAAPGIERLRAAGARVEVWTHEEGHRIPAGTGARVERWLDAAGL